MHMHEEGVATHSSILAWRSPMDREAWRCSPWGRKSQTWLSDSAHSTCICVAESLCPSPEVTTTLLIGYILIHNALIFFKKLKLKNIKISRWNDPEFRAGPMFRREEGQFETQTQRRCRQVEAMWWQSYTDQSWGSGVASSPCNLGERDRFSLQASRNKHPCQNLDCGRRLPELWGSESVIWGQLVLDSL